MKTTPLHLIQASALLDDDSPTALLDLPGLAAAARVRRVLVKAENQRPLGNFKVLGGMVAALRALARATGIQTLEELQVTARLPGLICASDGNHGLAVTAAAKKAGTRAAIYLPAGVAANRAERIRQLGGEVIWVQSSYDDAVLQAAAAASNGTGLLVPDTSEDINDVAVNDVMDGYSLICTELQQQLPTDAAQRPSHLFIQAGVGGLAAAMAQGMRDSMCEPRRLIIVEPASAACVALALRVGHPVYAKGDLQTSAQMLSCGLASAPALAILLQHQASAISVSETQLQAAINIMQNRGGPASTASGCAGLAGLLHVAADTGLRAEHGLDEESCVLLVVSEGV
ncbi:pyridoxal-phosphate dependent enzyme [Undibacterium sp. JH2W]|uniref:pyridoxal-phosphate dependent enzyme n=1 Tax=Undibacterium sp. JH2W TaxID=3413037 RepID=UPI003BF001A9